jgi:uncharacterized membrane protein
MPKVGCKVYKKKISVFMTVVVLVVAMVVAMTVARGIAVVVVSLNVFGQRRLGRPLPLILLKNGK